MKYVNTDSLERVWPNLSNPATGTTLELKPGEVVDLDPKNLPEDFEDAFLKPVASPKAFSKNLPNEKGSGKASDAPTP